MNFESIYTSYWQKVYRLCMGYVNDEGAAKDLAQETFVIVWQKLPQFRNQSAIGTWIFKIASNLCLRQIEKDKKIPLTELPCVELPDAPQNSNDESKVRMMYKCISELPEIDRLIISMELEDMPQAEIATVIGLSDGNIRVRIHRIKEKLTKKLLNYGQE